MLTASRPLNKSASFLIHFLISQRNIYPTKMQQLDFHVKFSFYCENTKSHKFLISDQILLKPTYSVDKYLFVLHA